MKYYFYRPRSTASFLTLLIKSNDQTNSSSPTMSTSVFYSSAFNSLYKSTGPKCQYFVLSVDNFLYNSER